MFPGPNEVTAVHNIASTGLRHLSELKNLSIFRNPVLHNA